MNNFLHEGTIVEVPAPYEVMAGDGLRLGSLFGIATEWARKGELVAIQTSGVFEVRRPVEMEWSVGDPVYWADATRSFTRHAALAVRVGVAVAPSLGTEHPCVKLKLTVFAGL